MTNADLIKLDDLLKAQDPPDLPARAHRLTQHGDPMRQQTVLLPLLTRWIVTRQIAKESN